MANYLVKMRFDQNGVIDATGKQWTATDVTYEEPGVFGGRAANFNGATSKILAEADAKLNLGTKDFTMACWLKISAKQGVGYGLIGETTTGYTSGVLVVGAISSYPGVFTPPMLIVRNSWQAALQGKDLFPLDNEWHHFAVVRKDGVFKTFLDGKMIIEDVNKVFINDNYNLGTKGTIIGDTGYAGVGKHGHLKGYLDDFVILDEAIWTEEFEPPEAPLDNPKLETSCCLAGKVSYYAMQKAPNGWLVCDGSEVSKTSYSRLYNAIGDVFGLPSNEENFVLPDLRGEFIRGFDAERGLDKDRQFGSNQKGSLQTVDPTLTAVCASGLLNTSTVNPSSPAVGYPEILENAGLDTPDISNYNDVGVAVVNGAVKNPIEYRTGVTRPHNVALLPCIKY